MSTPLLVEGEGWTLRAGERLWLRRTGGLREQLWDSVAASWPGPHGYLPHNDGLLANLRVWENCLLPHHYFGPRPALGDEAKLLQALAQLGWVDEAAQRLLGSPVTVLNLHERQAVSVLRVLMSQPALIMLETEWLNGLMTAWALQVASVLQKYCPQAAWLVLGEQAPAACWQIRQGEHHEAAA